MTDARERPCYPDDALLRARDFTNEQTYLAGSQRLRNGGPHTWGIADGLEVVPVPGRLAVTVTPGMAVDVRGRQIVLDRPTVVDLAKAGRPLAVYLTLAMTDGFAAWRPFPHGGGWTRRVETPVLALVDARPVDGAPIALAKLVVTAGGRLQPPDLSMRRYCGLRVGHVVFPRPDVPDDQRPRIGMVDGGAAELTVTAQRTNVFGSTRIDGRIVVGVETTKEPALLTVRPEAPSPGPGSITVADGVGVGSSARAMAALRPGDMLQVAGQRLMVAETLGRRTLALTAESPAARNSRYTNERFAADPNVVVRVRTGDLADALCIKNVGVVGIGREPSDAAGGLVVGNGDIRLDSGAALLFQTSGTVQAGGGNHAMRFESGSLTIRSAGDVGFFSGRSAPDAQPNLIVTPQRQVGIGVTVVGSTLTVNGAIRTTGGLIFPDGSAQADAISDLPVGAVIDWWRPPGDNRRWSRDGFQLCDGSEIVDPASPLVGQKTPDLSERFVRGVVSVHDIGSTGGAAEHTHLLQPHTHVAAHQHQISGATQASTDTVAAATGDLTASGKTHVHQISTTSTEAFPDKTEPPTIPTDGKPAETASASNIPVCMDLLKVMRIK